VPLPSLGVFVSSTWLDLEPERKAVEKALQRMRMPSFIGMEYFGSRDETTQRASLDEVDRSHVYVGIFAARYGSGITEDEYRRAQERGLHCLIYFKSEATITLDKSEKSTKQRGRLNKLKAELLKAHTVVEFVTPDDLAARVTADLHRWIFDKYRPQIEAEEASASTIPALHHLPPPPRDFTGRTEELAELTNALKHGGVNISGLRGMGGIGKTALALKLAEQLTPLYPDAQFYLDLKGTSAQSLSVAEAMSHVIRAYNLTAPLPDDEAKLKVIYQFVLHNQRALLLMDNAKDGAQVEPLIPPAGCVLLVTSRQHFPLPGLFAKDLDTLSPDDADKLLLTIAPRIGDHAGVIAKLCGYLPLALRLAASALAERKDLSPPDYVRRLTDEQQRLKLLDKIEASIRLSYELLKPETQKLWRTLAVFPDTFGPLAAAAVWEMEQDAAQDALGEMLNYSLVDWDETISRYRLHDLARLFARNCLSEAELKEGQWLHAAHYLKIIQLANTLYLQGSDALMQGLALFDAEWVNIQVGQSWAGRNAAEDKRALELCNDYPTSANILDLRQHVRQRISWLEIGLKAARELGRKRSEGEFLNSLGVASTELGDMRRAIKFHEQALLIDREVGDRHGEGNALGNLGNAYADLGDTHRAIEFYEQQLVITREISDRRGEGRALGNLGTAYADSGEARRAIEFYEQALLIRREIGDRRGEGTTLWNISLELDELSDRAQAIAYAEAALKILEEIEDPRAEKIREQLAQWREQE
jgi:tetratricopeptide (TPR) repeat protein